MNTTNTVGPANRRKAKKIWLPGCQVAAIVVILIFISPVTSFSDNSLELRYTSRFQGFSANNTCSEDSDCKNVWWIKPYPECSEQNCKCPNGGCKHYTTRYLGLYYYCGKCGELGSVCSDSKSCRDPGVCKNGYCSCIIGEVIFDVCVQVDKLTNLKSIFTLIGILILIMVLHRLFLWRNTLKNLACRIIRCQWNYNVDEPAVGYNPDSQEKSAAYTISSREFNVSSNDPDLAWALELSTQMEIDSQRNQIHEEQAVARHRNRQLMRRNRSIRREYNGFSQGSSSSRSSTRSNGSGRYVSNSSTFSSAASSVNSTPLSSLRREVLNDDIRRNKRKGYYSLRNQPENSGEIILTGILTQRQSSISSESIPTEKQSSSTHPDSISAVDSAERQSSSAYPDSIRVVDTAKQTNSFPTGARPKQNNKYKPLGKHGDQRNNTFMVICAFPLANTSNFSDNSSSTYSSARSNLSRTSSVSSKSNRSSGNLQMDDVKQQVEEFKDENNDIFSKL